MTTLLLEARPTLPHLQGTPPELTQIGTRPRHPDFKTIAKGSREHCRVLAMAGFAWAILPQPAPITKPFLRAMDAVTKMGAEGCHVWPGQDGGKLYSGAAMAAMLATAKDTVMRFNRVGNVVEVVYRGQVWATLPGEYMRDGIPSVMVPKPDAFDPFGRMAFNFDMIGSNMHLSLKVGGVDGNELPAGSLSQLSLNAYTPDLTSARYLASQAWAYLADAPRHLLGRLELHATYTSGVPRGPAYNPRFEPEAAPVTELFTPITSADWQTYGGGSPWQMAQAQSRARFLLDTQRVSQDTPGTQVVFCVPGVEGLRDDQYCRVTNPSAAWKPEPEAFPVAWVRDGQTLAARPIKGGQDTMDNARRYAVRLSQEAHNRGQTLRVFEFIAEYGGPRQFVALADGAARTITLGPGSEALERGAWRDGMPVDRYEPDQITWGFTKRVAFNPMDMDEKPALTFNPAAAQEDPEPEVPVLPLAAPQEAQQEDEAPMPQPVPTMASMGTLAVTIDPDKLAVFQAMANRLETADGMARALRRFLSGVATTLELNTALSGYEATRHE